MRVTGDVPGASLRASKEVDRACRESAGQRSRAHVDLVADCPALLLRLEGDVFGPGSLNDDPLCRGGPRARPPPWMQLEWQGERSVLRERVDLGVPVDTPNGLMLPIVRAEGGLVSFGLRPDRGYLRAEASSSSMRATFGPDRLVASHVAASHVSTMVVMAAGPMIWAPIVRIWALLLRIARSAL